MHRVGSAVMPALSGEKAYGDYCTSRAPRAPRAPRALVAVCGRVIMYKQGSQHPAILSPDAKSCFSLLIMGISLWIKTFV